MKIKSMGMKRNRLMNWHTVVNHIYVFLGVPAGLSRYIYLNIKPYLLVSQFDIYVQPTVVSLLVGAGSWAGKQLIAYAWRNAKIYWNKKTKITKT